MRSVIDRIVTALRGPSLGRMQAVIELSLDQFGLTGQVAVARLVDSPLIECRYLVAIRSERVIGQDTLDLLRGHFCDAIDAALMVRLSPLDLMVVARQYRAADFEPQVPAEVAADRLADVVRRDQEADEGDPTVDATLPFPEKPVFDLDDAAHMGGPVRPAYGDFGGATIPMESAQGWPDIGASVAASSRKGSVAV